MLLQIVIALLLVSPCFAGGQFSSALKSTTTENSQIPQFYWGAHLNEGQGSTGIDVSTNQNNLNTITGDVTWVNGKIASAIQINAVNSFFTTGAGSAGVWKFNRYTIEGWAYIKDMGGSGGCNTHQGLGNCGVFLAVGGGGGDFPIEFGYLPNGNMWIDTGGITGSFDDNLSSAFTIGDVNFSSSPKALTTGVWHYYSIVGSTTGRDNPNGFGSITFYIDGSSVAVFSNPVNPMLGWTVPAVALRVSLGRHPASAHGTGVGIILDDWQIYNSSSSASEVKNRYFNAISQKPYIDEE